MQELILLAGPNGAGKTSFANEFLPSWREGLVYVNADEVARALASSSADPVEQVDIKAARLMLEQIDALTMDRQGLMIETTLSSRSYAARIPVWKDMGYSISLLYLRLPGEEVAIERVRRRVAAGGHDIPEEIIRRRFRRSLHNLEIVYKPIVDEWYIWDSLEGDFSYSQGWDD